MKLLVCYSSCLPAWSWASLLDQLVLSLTRAWGQMSSSEPSRLVEEQQLLTLVGLLCVLVYVGGGLPHFRIFVWVVILYSFQAHIKAKTGVNY